MDKDEFYGHLHDQLGGKYDLTMSQVKLIRTLVVGYQHSRKEASHWLLDKTNQLRAYERISRLTMEKSHLLPQGSQILHLLYIRPIHRFNATYRI